VNSKKNPFPLAHHVFFWLKEPGSVQARKQLMEGIRTLENIAGVGQLHIGVPADTEKRDVVDHSYDVCELIMFATKEAQAEYQVHPIHKAFVEKYSHLWSKVLVYDSLES